MNSNIFSHKICNIIIKLFFVFIFFNLIEKIVQEMSYVQINIFILVMHITFSEACLILTYMYTNLFCQNHIESLNIVYLFAVHFDKYFIHLFSG
jgi:hypothetical protein